jgi:hypothetical protein
MLVGQAQCPYHASQLFTELSMSVSQAQCPYHATQLSIELNMSVGQAQCPYHATQPEISSSNLPRLFPSFCQTPNHTFKPSYIHNRKFHLSLLNHIQANIIQ